MTRSTTYPTVWQSALGHLNIKPVPADVDVVDASYAEEYVRLVQPDELGLLWPLRLTIERDEGAFVASDDITDVYGEGATHEQAIASYRAALSGLRRVLETREPDLTPDLARRLAVLRSIVPPGA